jgi:hypothetical protein
MRYSMTRGSGGGSTVGSSCWLIHLPARVIERDTVWSFGEAKLLQSMNPISPLTGSGAPTFCTISMILLPRCTNLPAFFAPEEGSLSRNHKYTFSRDAKAECRAVPWAAWSSTRVVNTAKRARVCYKLPQKVDGEGNEPATRDESHLRYWCWPPSSYFPFP